MQASQKLDLNKIKIDSEIKYEAYSYFISSASSLLLYAQINQKFARELETKIKTSLSVRQRAICREIRFGSMIIIPMDKDIAERRTNWLLYQLSSSSVPQAKEAIGLLQAWAYAKNDLEKQVIIGIVGLAIPGVTLGKISRRRTMSIIICDSIATKREMPIAKKIAQASQEVLKVSLNLANGNVRQLEPDIADWFFGDKEMLFYQTSSQKMQKIKKELNVLSIPCAEERFNGLPAILAISPATNNEFEMMNWNIKVLA